MSGEVIRELLQTSPVEGMPGWETRLFLITYPPGADASNHSHPVIGIGLVLEGTMVSAFDNDPRRASQPIKASVIERASIALAATAARRRPCNSSLLIPSEKVSPILSGLKSDSETSFRSLACSLRSFCADELQVVDTENPLICVNRARNYRL